MATYTDAYKSIISEYENGKLSKTSNLFDYLDKAVFANPNGDEIKAFTSADLACPPTATCLGTIDAIVKCAGGISGNISVKSTAKCPVKIGITKRQLIATKNPTKIFTDQSGTAGFTKACVTLTPELQSVTIQMDAMIDECNDCGDFSAGIAKLSSEAVFLGTEADLMATFIANAGSALVLSGDLWARLRDLTKAVETVPTNRNKTVTLYANQSVIKEIRWLRDNNGKPLFDYIGVCPITGCETLCWYGLKIVGVDDTILPIVAGLTNVFAVCDDNVFRTESPVEQKSKTWDQCCLENMLNKIVTFNFVTSKIDATMFPGSVKMTQIAI